MISYRTSILLLCIIQLSQVCLCRDIERDIEGRGAVTQNVPALSGTLFSIGIIDGGAYYFDLNTQQNTATSVTGNARSGTNMFAFGGQNGRLTNTTFYIQNNAYNNEASSMRGAAVSGHQQVFNQITDKTNISIISESNGNTAFVRGTQPPGNTQQPPAISGVQNQMAKVENSRVTINSVTRLNEANNNYNGLSIAGSQNSFGSLVNSTTSINLDATQNTAYTVQGNSIAGVQNNVNQNINSDITLTSTADQNNAQSAQGTAISGIQNNFNIITQYQQQQQSASLTTNDQATRNIATSNEGKSISGVQTNINQIKNNEVNINSYSSGNSATTNGEDNKSEDSLSGVGVNINKIQNSKISIYADSNQNTAENFNTAKGSDATSGIGINIGNVKNSDISIDLNSEDNEAYAQNGDAISGIYLNIQKIDKKSTINQINIQSSGGNATAPNGQAIIDSKIRIGN